MLLLINMNKRYFHSLFIAIYTVLLCVVGKFIYSTVNSYVTSTQIGYDTVPELVLELSMLGIFFVLLIISIIHNFKLRLIPINSLHKNYLILSTLNMTLLALPLFYAFIIDNQYAALLLVPLAPLIFTMWIISIFMGFVLLRKNK